MISAISIATLCLRFSSHYITSAVFVWRICGTRKRTVLRSVRRKNEIRSARYVYIRIYAYKVDRIGFSGGRPSRSSAPYRHSRLAPLSHTVPSREATRYFAPLLVPSATTRPRMPSRGTCPNQFLAAHSTRPDARRAHPNTIADLLNSCAR